MTRELIYWLQLRDAYVTWFFAASDVAARWEAMKGFKIADAHVESLAI